MSPEDPRTKLPKCSEAGCARPAFASVRIMSLIGLLAGPKIDLCRSHVVALCERTRWPKRVVSTPYISNKQLAELEAADAD